MSTIVMGRYDGLGDTRATRVVMTVFSTALVLALMWYCYSVSSWVRAQGQNAMIIPANQNEISNAGTLGTDNKRSSAVAP